MPLRLDLLIIFKKFSLTYRFSFIFLSHALINWLKFNTIKNLGNRYILNTTKYLIIYFLIILIYTVAFYFQNSTKVNLLDSSGLGSFLSGLFAPIAFIYLYLGYRQQEKALNRTNQDLLEQLKIQKKMLELQLKDQLAKEHAAQPIIDFEVYADELPYEKQRINNETGRPIESYHWKFTFIVTNSGEKISQVNVKCLKPLNNNIAYNKVIDKSQVLEAHLYLKEDEIKEYSIEDSIDLELQIEYRTSIGLKYILKYQVTAFKYEASSHLGLIYSAKSNPIQID
ncbi:hypothetical protein [Acinetobacter nosocomialis]|uniref:hypothetical protein n=1 Tax=Acinetobacter nosocomialis TaxID=106654 RepID=UPI00281014D9|nr:hypothetical protein [Acinetobacter nosocomialis]MDQ9028578.1 hypothetical protein [Acinetobacter nosocomialis]MDQ9045854.1 hypothetical protein [Acinetobacter nosocomialis]MDQ9083266.1 hypothetical protein [Acinetobacter nosocomialis]